jgi:hypothetical protein
VTGSRGTESEPWLPRAHEVWRWRAGLALRRRHHGPAKSDRELLPITGDVRIAEGPGRCRTSTRKERGTQQREQVRGVGCALALGRGAWKPADRQDASPHLQNMDTQSTHRTLKRERVLQLKQSRKKEYKT